MSNLPDHVGIDFGNHSVKAVELGNVQSPTPSLLSFGSQVTPSGVINSEDSTHQQKLSDALKELYKTSGIHNKKVVLAIPESSVFTRFIELPGLKEDEIEKAVFFEAKQYIPIPIEEVQMSYVPLGFDEQKNAHKILLVAAPVKIIEIYLNVVSKAGLEPLAIETESIAMGRAMYRSTKLPHVVMVDFGAQSTDMSIMRDGQLVFSQSIAIGSDSMTQSLVNQFGFEYNQAEEYKRNYGMTANVLENKIYNTLKPILDAILLEVQRGVEFYKSTTMSPAPMDYLLNGDGAMLPGLAEYLTLSLGVKSYIADPWLNIQIPPKYQEVINKSKPSYSVAIGLALKNA